MWTAKITSIVDNGDGTKTVNLQSYNDGVIGPTRSVTVPATVKANWILFRLTKYLQGLNNVVPADNTAIKALIGTSIGAGPWTVQIVSITVVGDGTVNILLQLKRNAVNGPSKTINIPDTVTKDWLVERTERWVGKFNDAESDPDDDADSSIIGIEVGTCLVKIQ